VEDGIMLRKSVLWEPILHHSLRYDLSGLTGIRSVLRLICDQRKFAK